MTKTIEKHIQKALEEQKELLAIFVVLKNLSSQNYLVGGSVRDLLLQKTPKDFDIVTDVDIDFLEKRLRESGFSVEGSGKIFFVLNVGINGKNFEVANFRKDGKYIDGRRPEKVEKSDIYEDAKRRDFTINALYLEPFSLEVIDPNGMGLQDLEERKLRFIGNPKERIEEDYLRLFRFYRFLSKGFEAEKKSLKEVRKLFGKYYPHITPERVREEIEKMVF